MLNKMNFLNYHVKNDKFVLKSNLNSLCYQGNNTNTTLVTKQEYPFDYLEDLNTWVQNNKNIISDLKKSEIQQCIEVSPYLYLYNLRIFINIFSYTNNISYKTKNLCTIFGKGYPLSLNKVNKKFKFFIRKLFLL